MASLTRKGTVRLVSPLLTVVVALVVILSVGIVVWAIVGVTPEGYSCSRKGQAQISKLEAEMDRRMTSLQEPTGYDDCDSSNTLAVEAGAVLNHKAVVRDAERHMGCTPIETSTKHPRHSRLLCHHQQLTFGVWVDSYPTFTTVYAQLYPEGTEPKDLPIEP